MSGIAEIETLQPMPRAEVNRISAGSDRHSFNASSDLKSRAFSLQHSRNVLLQRHSEREQQKAFTTLHTQVAVNRERRESFPTYAGFPPEQER